MATFRSPAGCHRGSGAPAGCPGGNVLVAGQLASRPLADRSSWPRPHRCAQPTARLIAGSTTGSGGAIAVHRAKRGAPQQQRAGGQRRQRWWIAGPGGDNGGEAFKAVICWPAAAALRRLLAHRSGVRQDVALTDSRVDVSSTQRMGGSIAMGRGNGVALTGSVLDASGASGGGSISLEATIREVTLQDSDVLARGGGGSVVTEEVAAAAPEAAPRGRRGGCSSAGSTQPRKPRKSHLQRRRRRWRRRNRQPPTPLSLPPPMAPRRAGLP